MYKFLDWYYSFYPLHNVSQTRRTWIHIGFWIVYGLIAGLASISNAPFGFEVLIFTSGIIQGAMIYYGIVYLIFPKLLSAKTFILGLFLFALLVYVYLLSNLAYYTICLNNNFMTPKSFLYEYGQVYVKNGIGGILRDKNFFFELTYILGAGLLPFLFKFTRILGVYSANVDRVSKEKTELEIYFLRTQLNPHFLFNSLNSIYSQIINQDTSAANSVIVLSNLLKYIIYNSADVFVSLKQEISFIRDYIDLEKMRNGNKVRIRFSQEGDFGKYVIAPLILTNFVENAFKHGQVEADEVLTISIEVKFEHEILFFTIENDSVPTAIKNEMPKSGGLGMINTKRRLELLYPNKHSLNIVKTDSKFRVEIQVKLNI
jgi:two-component system, LytTR family, sensor kinase